MSLISMSDILNQVLQLFFPMIVDSPIESSKIPNNMKNSYTPRAQTAAISLKPEQALRYYGLSHHTRLYMS